MNNIKLTLLAIATLIMAACNTTKKSVSTAPVSAPATTTTNANTSNIMLLKPKPVNGIYEPGDEELAVIKTQFPSTTLDQLKQGHILYSQSACVKCHGAIPINEIADNKWQEIIDDMANKAYLSASEKDAVNKYVLAIKAIQNHK